MILSFKEALWFTRWTHVFYGYPNSEEHLLVPIHEPPHNTAEGSEFLDDALRMHDQPLIYTEESVAAGSPKNLL